MADSAPGEQLDRRRDLVVIGASAGGVEALKRVVERLPPDLGAAVCIVLHIAPGNPSALAAILSRAGRLPCRDAEDGQPLQQGEIVVAQPDRHLVIEGRRVRLTAGPREHGHRPAVDVLFRSAAAALQHRVVGVVLSGTRDDGAAGLAVIKAAGGAAVIQSRVDAKYPDMPINALNTVAAADAVVPAYRMGETIAAIVRGEEPPHGETQAEDQQVPSEAGRSS